MTYGTPVSDTNYGASYDISASLDIDGEQQDATVSLNVLFPDQIAVAPNLTEAMKDDTFQAFLDYIAACPLLTSCSAVKKYPTSVSVAPTT